MSQQIILEPLGIITQPNKLGSIPAGSFAEALNAYMRSLGEVESALAWEIAKDFSANITAPVTLVFLIHPTRFIQQTLVLARSGFGTPNQWFWGYINFATGTFLRVGTLTNEIGVTNPYGLQYLTEAGASWINSDYHVLLSCDLGCLAFDIPTDDVDPTYWTPRQSGMLAPFLCYPTGAAFSTVSGAIAPNTHVHFTAIIRRKFSEFTPAVGDVYELVSAPAVANHYVNNNGTTTYATYDVRVFFTNTFVRVGDLVEVYRTRAQPYVSGTFPAPPTATNTGSDYYLSVSKYITATDKSNAFVVIRDNTPDTALGQALYTNDALGGAQASSLPPPTCTSMFSFKGYAFFLGIYNPAQFRVRPVYGWGNSTQSAAASPTPPEVRLKNFGSLAFTGTTSIGSPVITGISAADMNGLTVGQQLSSSVFSTPPSAAPGFTLYPTITAIGALSITVNQNATIAGSTVYYASDTFTINGTIYLASSAQQLATALAASFRMECLSFVLSPSSAYDTTTIPADYVVIRDARFYGQFLTSKLTLAVSATRGFLLEPQAAETSGGTTKLFSAVYDYNAFAWSEQNQPENCPAGNSNSIGRGTLWRGFSTRDAAWIFASDGLWRLSGTGGSVSSGYDWRVDPVDTTLILAGPNAACVLRDTVFAYTNRGFVSITSDGTVNELTAGRLEDVLPGASWLTAGCFVVPDHKNDEILLRTGSADAIVWRYNSKTDKFTKDSVSTLLTHGAWIPNFDAPYLVGTGGTAGRAYRNSAAYASMDLTYQPVYADNPFAQRQWQQLDIAADDVTTTANLYLNDSVSSVGARSLTVANPGTYSRTGWAIPRNAPAVTNNIKIRLTFAAGAKTTLQGVAVKFNDFTDQRKNR